MILLSSRGTQRTHMSGAERNARKLMASEREMIRMNYREI